MPLLLPPDIPPDITYDLAPIIISPSTSQTNPVQNQGGHALIQGGHGGPPLLETLIQNQSSASISNMGTGDVISLRGFGDNAVSNINILYNGISLNTPSLAGPDLNLINPSLLSSYQINPYSGSANNAVAGSIDFFTLPDNQDNAEISFTQGWPKENNLFASTTHVFSDQNQNPSQNKIKIFAFSTQKNTNRIGESTDIAQFALQTINTGPKNTTQFFIQTGPEFDSYPGALTQAQVNQNRNQIGDQPGTFNAINTLGSFSTSSILNSYFTGALSITHQEQDGDGVWLSDNYHYTQNSQTSTLTPSLIWQDLKNKISLSETLTQSTYSNTGLNNAHLFSTESSLDISHIFNPYWTLKSGVSFISSSQSDSDSSSNSSSNPNNQNSLWISHLDLLLNINSHWDLKLSQDGSYKLPLADENSDTLANTSLQPQTGIDHSATVNFHENNYSSSLELYQLTLHNEIAFIPANANSNNTNNPWGANINLPKTIHQGLIFNNQEKITKTWNLQESVSLMRNYFPDSGKTIPWTSPFLTNITSVFNLSPNIQWTLGANYTGSRFASSDTENIGGTFGNYLLINTGVSYSNKNFTSNLSLQNLTNKNYYEYVIYSPNGDGFYPAEGIEVLLTLSLKV